jgi:tetratricopeptide (TPR) repeat protein
LAFLYDNQGKFNLAEEYYLIAIEKGDEDAFFFLAFLYDKQGKFNLAEKYYLKSIENGNEKALFNLGLLYNYQSSYTLAEKYYLKAVEKGDEDAFLNLAFLYYLDLKNINKLKSLFEKWEGNSIDKRQFQVLSQLWNGELQGVQQKVTELAIEEDGIDEMFLTHLLIHYQKNLVWKLFNDPETGVLLKNKFAPLYYATSILIDNEESKLNILKTPPEIEETVKDILNKIENLRKEYYQEN